MKPAHQRTVLRVLGMLSILLPAVLVAGTAALDHCTVVLASVSHYYYTSMNPLFVGLLYATGLFLFLYKGDTTAQTATTRFAAVCVVAVALLPTSNDIYGCSTRAYQPNALGEELHKAFAAFFLLAMSVLFCLFARENGSRDRQARFRNQIYYTCAATIGILVFTIVALSKPDWYGGEIRQRLVDWTTAYKPVFWLEWPAFVALGTSWLIKGEWLLANRPTYQQQPVLTDVEFA
ncbi:hypothetical protein [Fibrella aquatilis]|uniref:DUF998 domain-containing protein n=1 Tax=Fibrella aquatilis TaxID=2817059 RepID=A0A939JXS5_9BACT|nr:hypothetical protein [Fibrella aquatilis]MBO0929618.1 hypothetical protein [Fibrella aquatilis]